MARKPYPTDLTDSQWKRIAPLIPPPKPGGRPRTVDLREVLNGIFYVTRTGCAWRMVPHDFPPWGTLWFYFRLWRENGLWERIHTRLREQVRRREGRKPSPRVAVLDSQSVKTSDRGGERGFDAGKKGPRPQAALVG